MIWLLIWNEGRAIQTYRAHVRRRVTGDFGRWCATIWPTGVVRDQRAVKSDQIPQDSHSGVIADRAVGLSRSVAMYQWVEKSESQTKRHWVAAKKRRRPIPTPRNGARTSSISSRFQAI